MVEAVPPDPVDAADLRTGPFSPQAVFIPHVSTPTTNWREGKTRVDAVFTAPMFNWDSMMGKTALPSSIDWQHHWVCFAYTAPSEEQEAQAEATYKRCKYDVRCASRTVREMPLNIDQQEELLGWWCRRCHEERRISEVGEAVKRWAGDRDILAKAYLLSGWCRFTTTARKSAQHASALSGGSPGLFRHWQRCREARSSPAQAAEEAVDSLRDEGSLSERASEAVEICCADTRCLTRALQAVAADAPLENQVWFKAEQYMTALGPGSVTPTQSRKKRSTGYLGGSARLC